MFVKCILHTYIKTFPNSHPIQFQQDSDCKHKFCNTHFTKLDNFSWESIIHKPSATAPYNKNTDKMYQKSSIAATLTPFELEWTDDKPLCSPYPTLTQSGNH